MIKKFVSYSEALFLPLIENCPTLILPQPRSASAACDPFLLKIRLTSTRDYGAE
jgi:hypothetical protein